MCFVHRTEVSTVFMWYRCCDYNLVYLLLIFVRVWLECSRTVKSSETIHRLEPQSYLRHSIIYLCKFHGFTSHLNCIDLATSHQFRERWGWCINQPKLLSDSHTKTLRESYLARTNRRMLDNITISNTFLKFDINMICHPNVVARHRWCT